MKVNDTIIFQQLNKNYEYLIGKFKEENVFGIFAFGKVNTEEGIQDISELTTEGIIFPTFEEICLNKRPPLKTIENNIIIKDVRCIFNDTTLTQNDPITEALFTDYRIINVKYLRFFEKYFYDKREKIHNRINIKDSEATNLLETGLTELMRNVLNINSTSINFLKSLTDSEKVALSAIIEKINDEGMISIVKLSQQKDISRYVFDELIQKMKTYKVATITTYGPKGTYIRVNDCRLLNF